MGRKQIRCHGSEERFEELAKFIHDKYGNSIKYIADVAGGQGLLSRILSKKYNYESEVIDPRGYVLKGVQNVQSEYLSEMASYYDLIVGLHPDEATKEVVYSSFMKPTIIIPCCNFWDLENKLGSKAMIISISKYLKKNNINYEVYTFSFKGPKNIGIITS
ncbi:MAG: hypothetical protein JW924_05195 [Fusobacteriaceae bacterium]|nr:hypothetical protein [Fusobacteriaceae bacterium]